MLVPPRDGASASEVDSTAVRTDAWHHRADAITSVAAFIGILIARVGGPGWERADAWAALFACAVIGLQRLPAARPGAGGDHGHRARTRRSQARCARPPRRWSGVDGIEKCRVRKMGLEYYVDLHVGVDGHDFRGRRARHRAPGQGCRAGAPSRGWPTCSCTSSRPTFASIPGSANCLSEK